MKNEQSSVSYSCGGGYPDALRRDLLIVLTHAHFDHAENAAQISSALGIPIGMNEKDCDLIASNKNQALSAETFLGNIVLSVSLKNFLRQSSLLKV